MNKLYRNISLVGALSLAPLLWAQPQLENAGFEDWNNVGTATEEPLEWSSVKTSDGGTVGEIGGEIGGETEGEIGG